MRALATGKTETAGAPGAVMHTLAAGTIVEATIQDTVLSRSNATGEHVHAIVSRNVMDGSRVVIPGGVTIVLTIAQLRPPGNSGDADGVIALDVTSLIVDGTSYQPSASVGAVPHTLKGRAITGHEGAANVADRDVFVTPGTPITITLKQPLKISAS